LGGTISKVEASNPTHAMPIFRRLNSHRRTPRTGLSPNPGGGRKYPSVTFIYGVRIIGNTQCWTRAKPPLDIPDISRLVYAPQTFLLAATQSLPTAGRNLEERNYQQKPDEHQLGGIKLKAISLSSIPHIGKQVEPVYRYYVSFSALIDRSLS
jgi:hypothetical protein